MVDEKVHYQHILRFYFHKGKNASEAHKKLCSVYRDKALSKRQCQNWLKEFIGGEVEVYNKKIKEIIDTDPHRTTRNIAEKLNASHTCIEKRLQQIGYLKKMDL